MSDRFADLSKEVVRSPMDLDETGQAARGVLFGGPPEFEAGDDRTATAAARHAGKVADSRLPQGFFAPAEIGAYLGLSTYTVQELCRRGDLRHVKVGRSIRIRRQWADVYMAAREREPMQ